MTYKNIIDLIKTNNISVLSIDVASACLDIFDFDFTDEEYEALCAKVEEVFISQLDLNCDIDSVAHAINDFVAEEGMPIPEVLELNKYTILERASYWN